jgi:hypothetical protein
VLSLKDYTIHPTTHEINDMIDTSQKRTQKIDIRYDPRNTSKIYYLDNNNNLYEFPLNDKIPENLSYKDITWKHYRTLKEAGRLMNEEYEDYQLQHLIVFDTKIETVVKEAESRKSVLKNNTHNIREARHIEKENLTVQHGFQKELRLSSSLTNTELSDYHDEIQNSSIDNPITETKINTFSASTEEERKNKVASDALSYLYDD